MIAIAILTVISFGCGLIAGLVLAQRIAQAVKAVASQLDIEAPKKKTGVVKMGLNAASTITEVTNTGVVRPKPPKSEDDDRKNALASARRRAGI